MFRTFWVAGLLFVVSGCQTVPLPAVDPSLPSIRYLLTFDDGPSADPDDNTTRRLLENLETNRVQPGTKALFFVQTRNPDGGGSELGQRLLQATQQQGHALALHSGTERGHIRHTLMTTDELAQSLRHGTADLQQITGDQPMLIRPPFWGYDDRTVELYSANKLGMLLTDVNTRDGFWLHNVVGMRTRIHNSLIHVRQGLQRGELPVRGGVVPIVVTFHDLNRFTASGLGQYMQMLVDEAAATGLKVAAKPFYDTRDEILEVAMLRAETPDTLAQRARLKQAGRTKTDTTTTAQAPAPTRFD